MGCEAGVGRTAIATGDLAAARASLARVEGLVVRWPVGAWMRDEARGWVAVGEERIDDAIRHLRAASADCLRAYDAGRLRLEAARPQATATR
jgi:hypothetical protein